MAYTLSEAAEATGKSRSTILRAIQKHKLAAVRAEISGGWEIEPAELHRCYPPIAHAPGDDASLTGDAPAVEVRVLRTQLAAAVERLADKDATIADLRARLDTEGEERRRLTAILTAPRQRRRWWFWR